MDSTSSTRKTIELPVPHSAKEREQLRRKSDRVSRSTGDAEVLALCKRRINLFTELGPTLRNPSPKDPNRAAKNRANTAARKRIKRELQENCDAICARVMQLFAAELGQLVP